MQACVTVVIFTRKKFGLICNTAITVIAASKTERCLMFKAKRFKTVQMSGKNGKPVIVIHLEVMFGLQTVTCLWGHYC